MGVMTNPAEKMREAAAATNGHISDETLRRWYDAMCNWDCGGEQAADEISEILSRRALPIPQEPPVEAMARALETAMDALSDSQWSGGSAERRCAAALAEHEAWKKGSG